MYTWPGTPFNGDRYKFENYLEVLNQQLHANNCLNIAKNEEEPQQEQQHGGIEEEPQQQQQHGGNSSNASLRSNSTSTRSGTTTITPTTADLQDTQLKIAEHERKSELGLAIICMSVIL